MWTRSHTVSSQWIATLHSGLVATANDGFLEFFPSLSLSSFTYSGGSVMEVVIFLHSWTVTARILFYKISAICCFPSMSFCFLPVYIFTTETHCSRPACPFQISTHLLRTGRWRFSCYSYTTRLERALLLWRSSWNIRHACMLLKIHSPCS